MPWQLGQFFCLRVKAECTWGGQFLVTCQKQSWPRQQIQQNSFLRENDKFQRRFRGCAVTLLTPFVHSLSTLSLSRAHLLVYLYIFIALFFFFCFINSHLSSVSDLKAMPFCGSSYAHCPHLTHQRSSQVRFWSQNCAVSLVRAFVALSFFISVHLSYDSDSKTPPYHGQSSSCWLINGVVSWVLIRLSVPGFGLEAWMRVRGQGFWRGCLVIVVAIWPWPEMGKKGGGWLSSVKKVFKSPSKESPEKKVNFSVIFHGSDASASGFDLGAPPFHQGLWVDWLMCG